MTWRGDDSTKKPSVTTTGTIPIGARLAGEIIKPKDWSAFQRNCVVLFREELRDPNTKEYGRNGQKQDGIDILGYRNGNPDHPVGIQCRKIDKSLKQSAVLKDCRDALALEFGLREIIFATTAPNDVKADQAAKAVERELRDEGFDVTVHVYGWDQLQLLIGLHEPAYNVFMPAAVATVLPAQIDNPGDRVADGFAAKLADEIAARLGGISIAPTPPSEPAGPGNIGNEDPALHAKIDLLRDLIKEGHGNSAEQRLIALRDSPEAVDAPWARYRIETNVAAALMDRGLEAEAADAYVRAHELRPDDPAALANLSIARTIQGDPEEGMEIARAILERPDRTEFAVSALLQAAARSDWQGDPESLVPEEMRGVAAVEISVADFLRRRWVPGWEKRVMALPDGTTALDDVSRLKALAVLSVAVDSRVHVVGGNEAVTDAQLNEAASTMRDLALHCLRTGYTHRHDLMAHVSNGALLLRLAGRQDEAESLLREGLKTLADDEQLLRLLAMVYIDRGNRDEAVRVLEPGNDAETVLMKVQFGRAGTSADRLATLRAMEDPADERVAGMRRRLIAELSLAAKDMGVLVEIIEEMRKYPGDVVAAELLDVEREKASGLAQEGVQNRLLEIAAGLSDETHPIDRFLVAEAMLENDMAAAAADLIEPLIDLNSPRPATFMYLTALAEARRDDKFRTELSRAAPDVRNNTDMIFVDARHSWNVGDLKRCLSDLDRLLEQKPDLPRAVLMRIETLLRLGRSGDVLTALDRPIEELAWAGARDPYRVANLLSHFGQHDRAARYAYRLFLQHRDRPRAWMTLSSMTLRDGQDAGSRPSNWSPTHVGDDVAVDLEYDDGTKAFFIVEPDASLRTMDPESWEPDHSLVKAVAGLRVDERFIGSDGREGRVAQLRHKIVARFHYVLANYERRFPEVFGFKSMSIDVESPNGLDEIIAQLKERHDWVLAEQESHLASGMPIGVLAARLGVDTIDVSAGLAEQGIKLSVAAGNELERLTARDAITANGGCGCVLDLATFWTAWRLKVLEPIAAVCGPISVPQSVVDRLRARHERLSLSIGTQHGTLSYHEGKILHTETTPEAVAAMRDDVIAALAWIDANNSSKPIVIDDNVPAALRDNVQSGVTDLLDAIVLSQTSGNLLVSDDLATRVMQDRLTGGRSAWLHAVLTEGAGRKLISAEDYTQQSVDLIDAGHSYIGISGSMIALGMEMDLLETGKLGPRSKALASRLGGKDAEMRSHFQAACEAIGQIWQTNSVKAVREAGTGLILENLIRERPDWQVALKAMEQFAIQFLGLLDYIRGWARGHFLPGYLNQPL